MALIKNNTFEGGTDNVAITAANSGGASGDAFSSVVDASSIVLYEATNARDTLCATATQPGTTVSAHTDWDSLGVLTSSVYFRMYVYVTALPSVNTAIGRIFNNAAAQVCRIFITSSGFFRFTNAANTTVQTGTVPVNTNAWSRLEWRIFPSATVGELEFRLFTTDPDGTTPDDAPTGLTNQILLADIDEAHFGYVSSGNAGAGYQLMWDDLAIATGDWIGPSGEPPEPPPSVVHNLNIVTRPSIRY